MTPRISRSPRRVGAIVATLVAVGAAAMAMLPSALAAAPTVTLPKPSTYSTSTSFPGGAFTSGTFTASCGAVGLSGSFLFGGSMHSGEALPNPYPVLSGNGPGGSGTTTNALKYVTLTLDGSYSVTGIVVVAYPNLSGSLLRYHYYTYTGVPAGALVVQNLVPPTVAKSSTTNGTFQTGSGSSAYTVIKRWFVCGTPAPVQTSAAAATTAPATTTATTPPPATTTPVTTPPATTVPATTRAPATTTAPVATTTTTALHPAASATPPPSPTGASTPSGLPRTGQNLSGLLWAGVALLCAGLAVLLFVGDRRSRRRGTGRDAETS